jgi:hypothetical protein
MRIVWVIFLVVHYWEIIKAVKIRDIWTNHAEKKSSKDPPPFQIRIQAKTAAFL